MVKTSQTVTIIQGKRNYVTVSVKETLGVDIMLTYHQDMTPGGSRGKKTLILINVKIASEVHEQRDVHDICDVCPT